MYFVDGAGVVVAVGAAVGVSIEMKTKARQIFENLWPANLICNAIVFMRINENWLCNKCTLFSVIFSFSFFCSF